MKNLCSFIILLQLTLLVSALIKGLGLEIPIIRQFLGFVYLIFIPGFLILKILHIDNRNATEILIYSIGLSLSFLMFIGALINSLYPIIGISKPISEMPLIISFNLLILLLYFVFYLRTKKFSYNFIDVREILSLSVAHAALLSLLLLPFLAIFGAYSILFHDSNAILLLLLGTISIIPIVTIISDFKKYPFIIWIMAISLALHYSLASPYVSSWGDNHIQYYIANLVKMKGFWDPTLPYRSNSLMSTAILCPIFSVLLDMSTTWTIKIIFPLIHSFTPVALYLVFKEQTNEKIAFLSSSLFMFVYFYITFAINIKFVTCTLFLVLIVYLMVNNKTNLIKERLLLVIFALSLIISHYGTSYFFMICLIISLFLSFPFIKRKTISRTVTSPNFILLYIAFTIAYYIYTANSTSFKALISFLEHFKNSIFTEFLSPETVYTLYALEAHWPLSIEVTKYFLIIISVLSIMGILSVLWDLLYRKHSIFNFNYEYISFSLSMLIMQASTFLPTSGYNVDRVYFISLIFLAPFAIIGYNNIIKFLSFGTLKENKYPIFGIFLTLLLLFSTGFFSETIIKGDDYSPLPLIHKERLSEIKDVMFITTFYGHYYPEVDVLSAMWLSENMIGECIYVDNLKWWAWGPLSSYGMLDEKPKYKYIRKNMSAISEQSYVYLRKYNYDEGIMIAKIYPKRTYYNIDEIRPLLDSLNKIYTNSGSTIYYR